MLSTLEDGRIVRGLDGVPTEGPVLFVGYHMIMGIEVGALIKEFLKERNVIIRGLTHPAAFSLFEETSRDEVAVDDILTLFGALPVTATNMYRLLSRKSFILLYPGGAREALHRKGEEYKLFWPEQPEFVRMAARFEATIVPFGVVGDDDISELVLGYDDQRRIPFLNNLIEELNQKHKNIRMDVGGEVANQPIFFPGLLPKVPGRFYYLFGKPIRTRGMKDVLRNREAANEQYLQIKSDIENSLAYLKRKREEDPYRGILQRTMHQASWGSSLQTPTFEL